MGPTIPNAPSRSRGPRRPPTCPHRISGRRRCGGAAPPVDKPARCARSGASMKSISLAPRSGERSGEGPAQIDERREHPPRRSGPHDCVAEALTCEHRNVTPRPRHAQRRLHRPAVPQWVRARLQRPENLWWSTQLRGCRSLLRSCSTSAPSSEGSLSGREPSSV